MDVVSVSNNQYSTMTEQNTNLYVEMIQVFITNVTSISIVSFKEVCYVQVLE